jgi:hypothetical protein
MSMRNLCVSVCLFCFFFYGCQSASAPRKTREETYKEVIHSWIGTHKDKLIAQFGPPTRESRLSDGGVSMVWEKMESRCCDPNYSYYYETCTMVFVVSTTDKIVNGSLSGC